MVALRIARAGAVVAAMTAFACGRPQFAIEATGDLTAGDGLECQAYLAADADRVDHVVLWMSGSGTLSNATVPESLVPAVRSGQVAYVTFNKPGIRAPFGEPESSSVNFDVLEKYTQGHLLNCAHEALLWAETRWGTEVQFLLRGHSEGSLISVYLYQALLRDNPERASRTPQLVLSGFPVEHISDIVTRQAGAFQEPDRKTIQDALSTCDWTVMQKAFAVSCAYLEDAAERPSGMKAFAQLAANFAAAEFHFFQGKEDANTPVTYVQELETWNAEAGHLNMNFSYYEGGHSGSDAARVAVERLIQQLTQPK